jgi:hypothetical protein
MEAKIEGNKEKMETSQDKIKATMKKNNEKMEAAIHSMKA